MSSALAAQWEAVASGDELLVGATEIGERPVTGPRLLAVVQQQGIGRAGRFLGLVRSESGVKLRGTE